MLLRRKPARPGPQSKGQSYTLDTPGFGTWVSLEDGARGRKKTGRKESEHPARCLAQGRSSVAFGVWSQGRKLEPWGNRGSGRSTGSSGRPGLHLVYPGIPLSGSLAQTTSFRQKLAEECERLGQGATTLQQNTAGPQSPQVFSFPGNIPAGPKVNWARHRPRL